MAAIVNNSLSYMSQNKAGCHAYMIAMDAMLVASGLTKLTFPTMYDVAGDETQIPTITSNYSVSGGITYAFNDAYQTTYPIFVRIYIGTLATTGTGWYCVTIQVGTKYSSETGALTIAGSSYLQSGAGGSTGAGVGTLSVSNTYAGSYVNYSGDSLVAIFGRYSRQSRYSGVPLISTARIIIHRNRDQANNVTDGYFALGNISEADTFVTTPTVSKTPLTAYTFSGAPGAITVTSASNNRAGDINNEFINSLPVIVPFTYLNHARTEFINSSVIYSCPMLPGMVYGDEFITLRINGIDKKFLITAYASELINNISGSRYIYLLRWYD